MSEDTREVTKAILVFILVMVMCLLVGRLFADESNRYPIGDIQVKDGDTIRADIHLGFGVVLNDETIRASDYDAWETSKRRTTVTVTDAEIRKGKIATQYLTDFLNGKPVAIEPNEKDNRDVYGRILGRWYVLDKGKWSSVAEIMKAAGHQR